MTIFEKLSAVQTELKAPKGQYNEYGGFRYRSCEDVLEAVKPICAKYKTVLMLTDSLEYIGGRYYVQAIAHFRDLEGPETISAHGFAREEETKKGMDGSQITGASSSYARKYALNGLFCIDDAKDSDFTNTGDAPHTKKSTSSVTQPSRNTKPQLPPDATSAHSEDVCDSCGSKISDKVRDFSVKKYGVPLCMDCQREYAR